MSIENIKSFYFIGAGGIGMSNLIRYFLSLHKQVAGYDRVKSELTTELEQEGCIIHYEDNLELIPSFCFPENKDEVLIVYTPAIPQEHNELKFFRKNGFRVVKRAELLWIITRSSKGLCVAGTHGKTTTSSMLAHLLHTSGIGCNAFLGGILKNYNSNLIISKTSPYSVIEADEFDRSFHQLSPYAAIITATDPDHLDIYHTPEAYWESFEHFTSLLHPEGILLMKKRVHITPQSPASVRKFSYDMEGEGDFTARNIRIGGGEIHFDFITPFGAPVCNLNLGVPVKVNIENAVAALALASLCGCSEEGLREGIHSFMGAKRRFDIRVVQGGHIYLDDYGHHPEEIRSSILSVKSLYPEKKLSVVFQPHLYTRTRDFAPQFAEALSLADEVILIPIYPARELPIEGVCSEMIYNSLTCREKYICRKEDLMDYITSRKDWEVLMTLGAGDIDRFVQPIEHYFLEW
ncbi:MAG TPA: UDP-N-acetylmuramate--L-alanine ligase [Porphyromonadaceae bacterium]|nr:UDP-N-acetylmuramate--L-alanine ligase [Porphyromonadaceae bacterium]